MYYSGWNLVLTLIIALFCGESNGIWPFSSVYAATDAQEHVYPDASAKRVAIIGMSNLSSSNLIFESLLLCPCLFLQNLGWFLRSRTIPGM
jgi:hypothetical protein